ncbi:MAG: hypothetical protein H6Q65_1054 [Firmicutes bacterium]|nr:hypothetical protein [Bacillota bacterium]
MDKIVLLALIMAGLFFSQPAAPAEAAVGWLNPSQLLAEEQNMLLLKEVWDAQTFVELRAGHVVVTDQVMNELLAENIAGSQKITGITVTSRENGQVELAVVTPSLGRVKIIGVLEEIHHDVNSSSITFRVVNKHLLDKPMVSWIFSRLSLAMLTKLYGNPVAGTDVFVTMQGNTVTADFHDYLHTTRIGQVNLLGYCLLDEVRITGAQTRAGSIILDTNLAITPELSALIPAFLQGG